jgi:hypothetical protein
VTRLVTFFSVFSKISMGCFQPGFLVIEPWEPNLPSVKFSVANVGYESWVFCALVETGNVACQVAWHCLALRTL